MDAKLKAKELVEKFKAEIYKGQLFINQRIERDHIEKAKECSLICCNTVINAFDSVDELKHETNQHYWQKVKEEITTL